MQMSALSVTTEPSIVCSNVAQKSSVPSKLRSFAINIVIHCGSSVVKTHSSMTLAKKSSPAV